MLNLPDAVTITREGVSSVDPDTGDPVLSDVDVLTGQPCAFDVLSAAQHEQNWGTDVDTTSTANVRANLVLPNYAALSAPLSDYTATVTGYPGTWRIAAQRPGASWTTYLLSF